MQELEDMSSRLNRLFGPSVRVTGTENKDLFADWAPAVDIEETATEYVIKADLPAMKKEDVKVSVEDGVLAIEGERRQEKEEKGKKFHRIERSFGTFVRRMALPTDVDQQRFVADFKDGVLNVHLPKTPTAASRKIEVKVT
jgi:HSP20 family protein